MNALIEARRFLTEAPRQRTGLRMFQAIVGAVYLYRIATEAPFAAYLWGPHSIAEGSARFLLGGFVGGAIDRIWTSLGATYALLGVFAAACLGLVFGRATRLASAVALACLVAVEQRLPSLADGGDNVSRLVLLYFVFALPPRAEAKPGSLPVWLHNLAALAVLFQGVVVYTTAGLMKAFGEKWTNGTALYLISQVDSFSHPTLAPLFSNAYLTTLATYGTLFFQVWFPVAVLSRLRLPWLVMGLSLHVGIAVMMGLISFSATMMGLELAFVTDDEYRAFGDGVRRLRGWAAAHLGRWRQGERPAVTTARVRLYLDGHCAVCRATWARLERWDSRAALDLRSFRHEASFRDDGIELAALERRMHAVDLRTGAVASGFGAVRLVAATLPRLYVLRPLLAVLGALGLGDCAYDFLAARRTIVSDGRACDNGVCRLPTVSEAEHSVGGAS